MPDLDKQLAKCLKESIAFPIDYKAPPSFLEIKLTEKRADEVVKIMIQMAKIRM